MALVVPIWSQAAAVYYVSPSGSDANAGTNPSAPWKTVGKAVTNLVAGQTAYLRAGTYSEKKTVVSAFRLCWQFCNTCRLSG